jgi:hypothetical protein
MNSHIFVQIASYRDPELPKTIKDLLAKAKYPERLTFGICRQYHPKDGFDDLSEYQNDSRFRILEYLWHESLGLCWARSLIQGLYQGEEYTLQLDSHHRFAPHWDDALIRMMDQTGSAKPMLTAYSTGFDTDNDQALDPTPYMMVPERFTSEGTIMFLPWEIPGWQKLNQPIPARFVSGHFFFTHGQHCQEYKYDPNIYFAGDEISLSIRSYTLGYDLFHPHRNLIWHEYTRKHRPKHWDDHVVGDNGDGAVKKPWWEIDAAGKRRLRQMLREEDNGLDLGEYGLGEARSHHDYERYAGIDFAQRLLHPKALQGAFPPTVEDGDWSWVSQELRKTEYRICYDWTRHREELWEPLGQELKSLYFGIEDEAGNLLYRRFFDGPEVLAGHALTHTAQFNSLRKPAKIVLWSLAKDDQWKNRVDIPVAVVLSSYSATF